MDEFYEWWDALEGEMYAWHDTNCAGSDDATPCTGTDRTWHVRGAYLMPHLQEMVRKSGIYKKEAN